MKYLAAVMLLKLGDDGEPTEEALADVLRAAGIEPDIDKIREVLRINFTDAMQLGAALLRAFENPELPCREYEHECR